MELTTNDYFKKYSNLYQFEEGSPEYLIDKEDFKKAMLEYGNQLLVKASKRAKLNEPTNDWQDRWVDKESILNLINELT